MSTSLAGALQGIRILDFSQVIFGPAATAVMADHGAEVIKVERPGAGDLSRAFGPFLHGVSVSYASINRGKKSLAINLKSEQGIEIVHKMLPAIDVVVSNFRPGVMDGLGLGYEAVSAINKKIVYAVGTGFGSTGPLAESRKPGHDTVAQALGGAMAENPGPDGAPRKIQLPVADMTAGNLLVQGILMALVARQRTGRGQKVEVSLLDSLLWLEAWQIASAANPTPDDQPRHGTNPLDGGIYGTSDGFVMVTVLFRSDPLKDLCKTLEIPDLSADSRFKDVQAMSRNAEALKSLLAPCFAEQTTDYWVKKLEAADFLAAPVLSTDEAIVQPQVVHNEMMVEVPVGGGNRHLHVGIPVKFDATPGAVRSGAPGVGEHTAQVLADIGYDEPEIAKLIEAGVVADGRSS